jgi:hypothetical protein
MKYGGILRIGFKLLVNDKGKFSALPIGITFAVFLMMEMTAMFAGILNRAYSTVTNIGAKGRELIYMILFMATFTALSGYGLGVGLVTLMITTARSRLPNLVRPSSGGRRWQRPNHPIPISVSSAQAGTRPDWPRPSQTAPSDPDPDGDRESPRRDHERRAGTGRKTVACPAPRAVPGRHSGIGVRRTQGERTGLRPAHLQWHRRASHQGGKTAPTS